MKIPDRAIAIVVGLGLAAGVGLVMALHRDWDSLRALGATVLVFALMLAAAQFVRSLHLRPPAFLAPVTRHPWLWVVVGLVLLGAGARFAVLGDWWNAAIVLATPGAAALCITAGVFIHHLAYLASADRRRPEVDQTAAIDIVWYGVFGRTDDPPVISWRRGVEWFYAPHLPRLVWRVRGLTVSPWDVTVARENPYTPLSQTALAHELAHAAEARSRLVVDFAHADPRWWSEVPGKLGLAEEARLALERHGL